MSKFKVGDAVKAISKTAPGWAGKPAEGILYITAFDIDHRGNDVIVCSSTFNDNGQGNFYTEKDLVRLEKTMDNLEQGDIISNGRCEIKVEGRIGDVYITTTQDGDGCAQVWSIQELEDEKYILKSDEDDVKEITLEEIAELAGVDVSKIRIKE